ncbi:MAG: hypothetical protein K2N22_05925, partial [Clostridia bacterium]|nr:hypothetical protein [Clostridia bacterium]
IRMLHRVILSTLRLPIPPHKHAFLLSFQFLCYFSVIYFLPKILSPLRLPIPPHKHIQNIKKPWLCAKALFGGATRI